jgi:DNA gyrase subunit B
MTDADVDGSHIRTLLLTFFFRHMTELIKRGHVFIAQPPLYRIKKGKFEQYIKDDREFVKVMVKRASDGMIVRYGENAAKIEGAALTKFMGQLNEFLNFYEKVDKRLRNDDVSTLLCKLELVKRDDFQGKPGAPPPKIKKLHDALEKMTKLHQFKGVNAPAFDEEHQTYSVTFVDAQGSERHVDWALASSPEYRQMMAKYTQIQEQLEPPFFIEYAKKDAKTTDAEAEAEAEEIESESGVADVAAAPGTVTETKPDKRGKNAKANAEPVEKKTARELFEHVIEQGRKEYQVQRYKGLGEMTSAQLWETTMDPEKRTLLQVKLEDIAATELIFTTLMGEDVESRRKFIEENALDVKNLDI